MKGIMNLFTKEEKLKILNGGEVVRKFTLKKGPYKGEKHVIRWSLGRMVEEIDGVPRIVVGRL